MMHGRKPCLRTRSRRGDGAMHRGLTVLGSLLLAMPIGIPIALAAPPAIEECTGVEDSKVLDPERLRTKLAGPVGGTRQITVEAKSIPVDATELPPGISVKYAARLSAAETHFCCWSALWVAEDGSELRAVSDNGKWVTAAIREQADGSLADLAATIGDLSCDNKGRLVSEKERREHDAPESMARLADGSWLVASECGELCGGEDSPNQRMHRVRLYPAGPETSQQGLAAPPLTPSPLPSDFSRQPPNRGPEGMTVLSGDRPLIFSENHYRRTTNECGATRAWLAKRPWGEIAGPGDWEELRYPLERMPSQSSAQNAKSETCYEVSGVAALPPQFGPDSFVVLERRFEPGDIMHVRLAISSASALRAGYPPKPIFTRTEGKGLPLTRRLLDNFEGIAVTPLQDGIAIWLISDDNADANQHKPCSADNPGEPEGCQRTVLLRLDYKPGDGASARRQSAPSDQFARPLDRD
jgi:hypothetical protein